MEKMIDLHVHSLFSDGKKNIVEMIEMAKKKNIGYLSFTEHYNLSSYQIAKELAGDDIEIIPGIEIGTDISEYGLNKQHQCHMLVYYPSTKICMMLDEYEQNREAAILKILDLLRKHQNITISYNQVCQCARNAEHITRFDVALTLAKLGFSKDPFTAYGEYLDYNAKCYVSRKKKTPIELIQYVKEVGGVIVVAHPKSIRMEREKEKNFFRELADAGLDGIEVYTPHNGEETRKRHLEYCKEFDLIYTAGSDYHGIKAREIEMGTGIRGNLNVTDIAIIENLKKRAKKKKVKELLWLK